jgi:phosphatidylglycerophosphate synthase
VPETNSAANERDRRPIGARSTGWAKSLTNLCLRIGLSPNSISVLSVCFAALGGLLFYLRSQTNSHSPAQICLFAAAACIELRLICNMLDGMVAVEANKQSKIGALFNELPDRLADCFFLVPAGYAAGAVGDFLRGFGNPEFYASSNNFGATLGWTAAVLAVLTAYIRAFGASQGLKQDFCGPMAKPHRMHCLAIGAGLSGVEVALRLESRALMFVLIVIIVGTAITCIRRTLHIAQALEWRD